MTDARLAAVKEETLQEPSPMQMISALVNSPDVTAEKVAIAEKLIAMRREMRADDAKQEFVRAFVKMQREMKAVRAMTVVEIDSRPVYKFAPFEAIRKQADPILSENGFGVSFDSRIEDDRLISTFTLMHEGGYSQSNSFACRILGTSKMMNVAQADMGTKSYAMRGAFCDGCGIVITKDTDGSDARGLGDTITPEQAEALRKRVRNSSEYVSEVKLLQFAEAKDFEEIREARYRKVIDYLDKADAKRKPTGEMF